MSEKEFTDLQVLLVEPSNTQQIVIRQLLRDCGISDVNCIDTGWQILESLKRHAPDLIMSAMYLPDMTGVDLIHKIRENSDSYNMAFVLISSETSIEYLEPIRQAGTIAILPKPFTSKQLDLALSATIDYLNPQQIKLNHLDNEDISVLLVDDSPLALKYVNKILEDIGISNISHAKNGKEALKLVNQHYFDLIFTDYNMPEMDGLQLAASIRSESNQKTIPIIMLTSEQNQSRLAAIKQAEFAAVLDKPFDPDTIRCLIMHLLN